MKEATVIYPHQLFSESPAIKSGRPIYLVEEPLLLTHNPIHRQKLLFHKLSMDAYEHDLVEKGHEVARLSIHERKTTSAVFERILSDGVGTVHIVDTTDDFLEQVISKANLDRVWYDSPLFILPKEEAVERYKSAKKFMASFYKQLRIDKGILVCDDKPEGGKWSFDEDNRKKLPKDIELPEDISFFGNEETKAAEAWVEAVDAEKYGKLGCWLPYTHEGAQKFFKEFLRTRFTDFGTYEDAIATEHTRIFHSAISPLMNVGLLNPKEVLDEALNYAKKHNVPMNSLEGFMRQILGWREFIRASYECDGRKMRSSNFWNHKKKLPAFFWDGETDIPPLKSSIATALSYGYTHHIERLMVVGNFMLLSQINPNEVYRWFMAMYVDAYDWVMVPNVYGMSQFADGGTFATKPYISGSNYLKKMSDYPSGDWEETWTALYWNFIGTHREFFESNHRLSMMPKLLDKMKDEKKKHYEEIATKFFSSAD